MVYRMTQAHPDIIPFPGRPPVAAAEANPPVLVVSCDLELAQQLAGDVQAAGHATRTAASLEAALQWLQVGPVDVCLIGPLAPGETASQLANIVQQRGWTTQLISVSDDPAADAAQQSSATAGIEQLPRSYTPGYLSLLVSSAAQRARLLGENRRLKRQLCNRNLRDMVGQSAAMQSLRQQVQHLADHASAVLIAGERGSGIDLVAQAIHDASRRAHRPFVAIDSSVHSADTLELELFGAPASSGAPRQSGRLEQADGGTLLLDSVHCVALPLQRRLAAVLHDQRFECERTGERIRFDVRVFFSTDVDLDELLRRGLFRAELLQDADQNRLTVPPLRSRPDDIAALAEHYLRRIAAREGRPSRSLTLDALHLLQSYHWPANLSELEHVIDRACSIDAGRKLTAPLLEPWLATAADDNTPAGLTLAEMERRLIETTFGRFAGNREKTAKALQIGIRTLSGKLREYGYPPRGGPGSNVRPWTPAFDEAPEQKAA
jgi:DNA-binding NtrC family response regulator